MQETHPLGYGLFRSYEPKVDDEGLAGPGWFEAGPVTAAFISLHDSSPADPPTRVRILFSDDGLFVGAECGEPDPAGMRTLVPAGHETGSLEIEGAALKYEFWKDDHFVLSVDPTHEAGDYYNFIVTAGGYARAGLMNYGYAEQVHANCRKADRADVEWHRRAAVAGDAWYAFYSVPWSSLGLSGPPEPAVVGFNALRYRGRPEGTTTSWTRVVSSHGPAAIDFGDLHLGDAKVFMPVADFRSPVFDHNTLKVTLEAPG